ncbi:MAG: putative Ig domain-containing protein [Nitrospirota bacterium]
MKAICSKACWVVAVVMAAMGGCDRTGSGPASGSNTRVVEAADSAVTSRAVSAQDAVLSVVFQPGIATAGQDLTAVANEAAATYAWFVNGIPVEGESGPVFPKTLLRRSDTVRVDVALNEQRAQVETMVQNSPPRASGVSLARPFDASQQRMDLTATPMGVDADGDEIQWEYQWTRNDEILTTETTHVLRGDRYQRGDRVTVTVTPHDHESRGEPYTSGVAEMSNAKPVFVSRPPSVTGGAHYVYRPQAIDPDGDPVQYRLLTGPAGMTMDPTGVIRWSLAGVGPGRQRVEVAADDGLGGSASQPFELDISSPEG